MRLAAGRLFVKPDLTETWGFPPACPQRLLAPPATEGSVQRKTRVLVANFWGSAAWLCHADEETSSISLLSSLFFIKGIHKVAPGKALRDSFGPQMMGLTSCPWREETLFHGRGRYCSDVASYCRNVCSSPYKWHFFSQTTSSSDELCD